MRQLRAQRMREIRLIQLEAPRLDLRLDLLDEMQVGCLRVRVVRVAGHRDVAPGSLFIQRRR